MSDHLRPVFPPDSPNISRESQEASIHLLDDETRDTLAVDRARLSQATAVTAIALTDALGLSEGTSVELQRALVARLPELSPQYHSYMNQLLGNTAVAIAGQEGASGAPIIEAVEVVDLPDDEEQEGSEGDIVDTPEPEADFDETDLLSFGDEMKLAQHSKPNSNIKLFVKKMFGEKGLLDGLSADEVSLVGYQLLNIYMANKIPNSSETRKATQKERLELYFALYGGKRRSEDICRELGVSSATFNAGIRRVIDSLRDLVGKEDLDNIIKKAKVTAEFGLDELFVDPKELNPQDLDTEEEQEITFKEYPRTPANMTNFLTGVYPDSFYDRLNYLEPWQASYLTFKLINFWKEELGRGNTTEEAQALRVSYLGRWTGLESEPQDFDVIARARAVVTNSIQVSINGSIEQIPKRIGLDELERLFEEAMNYAKPVNSTS